MIAAPLEAPRAGVRPVTVTAPARRAGVAWPQLPAAAEPASASHFLLDAAAVDSPGTQKIMSREVREDVSRSRREPAASARAGA